MQSGLSVIKKWQRTRFDTFLKTLTNCHAWGCMIYVLELSLQKPGVKNIKWAPRSQRGINTEFRNI